MSKLFKMIFQYLSFGSLTLTSCVKYGIPIDIDPYKAIKTQTENNMPIEGLSVKLIRNSDTVLTQNTDSNGLAPFNFDFYDSETYSVLIEDIDGEDNLGKFDTKEVNLTEPDTTITEMKKQ